MSVKCRHLSISDEAYCNGVPAPVFLCGWTASKLAGSPAWFRKQVGGGMKVNPQDDCATCQAFDIARQTE